MVGIAVVFRDARVSAGSPPGTAAPVLAELNESIGLAEHYLDGLYKPLGNGVAVQSETYGIPIHVHFASPGKPQEWVLSGEGEIGECGGTCDPAPGITPGPGSRTSESYRYEFGGKLVVDVRVEWNATDRDLAVTVTPEKVGERAEIWLDRLVLAVFDPGDTVSATQTFTKTDLSMFRSLRYTVRHATQSAYLYWTLRGDRDRAGTLSGFLRHNGYTPGLDMRAVIFGMSKGLPEDLPFNDAAYQDCSHLPAATPGVYPYESKACSLMSAYLQAGARDPFLQASQALHTLQQRGDPAAQYPMSLLERGWLQGSTPKETSRHLQGRWDYLRFGIPSCTPLTCSDYASGIRTSIFGTLETEFGYRYGDPAAQRYADAAAAATVASQVKKDGLVRLGSTELYRPVQIGAFLAAWNEDNAFTAPSNPLAAFGPLAVATSHPMPPEYRGVQASNSETTFDAWAFLTRYRCARYGVGCGP
jgi:hypothetical protein